MHVGSYLLWAFVATLVLSGGMYAAQEAGLSRMSIPFLLGAAWTTDHRRAVATGSLLHAFNGLVFALLYVAGFELLGTATWWLGALGGAAHAFVVLTAGMEVLTAIHPNMADDRQGPTPTRWLEPPGLLALNYGRRTPLVALVMHVVYGAILGAFYQV